mgnify:CR=1 FL=1
MGIFGSLFGAPGSTTLEQANREAYEELKRRAETGWVISNTAAPKQWTNINLAAPASHSHTDSLQEIYDKVGYWASHMHPAYTDDIVEDLIKLSSSGDPRHRLMAAQHRLTPEACRVMMQNDPDSKVREAVEKVLRYNEERRDE